MIKNVVEGAQMSRDADIKNDSTNALIDMVHQIGLDVFAAYKPIADDKK